MQIGLRKNGNEGFYYRDENMSFLHDLGTNGLKKQFYSFTVRAFQNTAVAQACKTVCGALRRET